ncbi:MAG TPA: CHAT domain-containing tetratricopeptide repeat protein [Blastocatellia bacterium]|nr:CHAT domain-containing tetratricopeptide repeat protein [Blastocatellia bacterium]
MSRTNHNVLIQQQTEEMQRLKEESGRLYREEKYDEAISIIERMIQITEQSRGALHPDMIIMLNGLANVYLAKGDYAKAESLFVRVLEMTGKARGPKHADTVRAINNLAALYEREGEYSKAESLYARALQIREETLGPMHPNTSTSLHNMGRMYEGRADYTEAERLYIRALDINEKSLGPKHLNTAILLSSLGVLYFEKGDYVKAEPLHERALEIYKELFGLKNTYTATGFNNLATLYQAKGNYAKAESFYKLDLEINEELGGPDALSTAGTLNNLATLYQTKGDYAKAESLYLRGLKITEQALGPEHPQTGAELYNLAGLYCVKGDVAKTLTLLSRVLQITEIDFRRNLTIGSNKQVSDNLKYTEYFKDFAISLQVRQSPQLVAARDFAFATLLHLKGRSLDAITDSLAALRRRASPEDLSLFDKLAQSRALLAAATLRGPGNADPAQYRANIKASEDEIEKIEIELSKRSSEFRQQISHITIDAVRKTITPGMALVEFAFYTPFNPSLKVEERKLGNSRYVAYVLNNQGDIKWVDLGEAAPIDEAVNRLHTVLRENKPLSDIDREVKPRARALDHLVMEPIRKLLGNTRQLLVAPDGALNLIPFQVLLDENNRYLVENYSISYLTTGRDLLRLQTQVPGTQETFIFANPNFGGDMSSCTKRKVSIVNNAVSDAVNFSELTFCPLPATAEEATVLKKVFPTARMLVQEQATESALKRIAGPKILHIATHGFFFENLVINSTTKGRGLLINQERPAKSMALRINRVENPLLRSGLAMTGANLHRGGDDDGVLTAFEVAGLNLWGTKLVVLSACDTGRGEIKNGEGVYGLRRALVLAGSETQVMSLWQVDDEGTRDLMIDYYKALQAGQGRSEALRNVQLRMLKSLNHQHPYFWASFIQSGEWANLDGKR